MASSSTDGGGRFKAVIIFPPKNQNQNSGALCMLTLILTASATLQQVDVLLLYHMTRIYLFGQI